MLKRGLASAIVLVAIPAFFSDAHAAVATTPATSAQREPNKPAPKPASSGIDPVIAKGIHRVSATQFEIQRSVVDKILGSQSEMQKIRVSPEQENGTPTGIRLYGIKKDSILGALGVENGDRFESINGIDIRSPANAIMAYPKLTTVDHLTVKLTRKGAPLTLEYDLR